MRSCGLVLVVFGLFVVAGCTPANPQPKPAGSSDSTAAKPEAGHAHEHPSEGPHGGGLIELGDEEYHAELVHDDKAGTVTIYLLDGAAKKAVAIEAADLTINVKHDGKAEQFKLAAKADSGDPAGKSSRFESTDKELAEDLEREGSDPQLVVEINGKQFRGAIEHHHHEGEEHGDHAHEKEKNGAKEGPPPE